MMERLRKLHREHLGLLERFREVDRMASVGLVASGLAHDINNPSRGSSSPWSAWRGTRGTGRRLRPTCPP
jgi:hypothetical protein